MQNCLRQSKCQENTPGVLAPAEDLRGAAFSKWLLNALIPLDEGLCGIEEWTQKQVVGPVLCWKRKMTLSGACPLICEGGVGTEFLPVSTVQITAPSHPPGLTSVPNPTPNSDIDTLIAKVTVFGDRSFPG